MNKHAMKQFAGLIILLFWINTGIAATHYVRPDGGSYGSENGADWTNAFDGLPATLTRGDTYAIAGGTYPNGWELDDAESSTTYIYIRKASSAQDSGVSGWQASFGSSQTVVYDQNDTTYGSAIVFKRGYYDVDGLTGSGQSGHGIKLRYGNLAQRNNIILIRDNTIGPISIKHCELENAGPSYDYNQISVQAISGNINGAMTFSYCYFHSFQVAIKLDRGSNHVIEYSYFEDNHSTASNHGEGFSIVCADGIVFRYNTFDNVANGTGGIIVLGNYLTYLCDVDNVEIYSNVFLNMSSGGNGQIATGNSSCSCGAVGWRVYNNTFVDSGSKFLYWPQRSSCGAYNGTEPVSDMIVKNNLIYSSSTFQDSSDTTVSYNYFNASTAIGTNYIDSSESVSELFLNYSGDDFQLSSDADAIDNADDLGATYQTDKNGVIRPQGGAWDMGAYEFIQSFTHTPSGTITLQ